MCVKSYGAPDSVLSLILTNHRQFHLMTSLDSTAQAGHPGATDLKGEIYQKIKSMKELYLPELTELHRKITMRCQQFPKSSILPTYKEKLPQLEKQIINYLAKNGCTKPAASQQSGHQQLQESVGQPHLLMQQPESQIHQLQQQENQGQQSSDVEGLDVSDKDEYDTEDSFINDTELVATAHTTDRCCSCSSDSYNSTLSSNSYKLQKQLSQLHQETDLNDLKVRPGAGVKPGMFPQRHLTGQQETISTAKDNSSSPSFFSSVPSCCITSTSSAFIPIDQPREFSFDSPNSGNIFAICSLSLLWNPPSHLCRAFHWDTWDPGLPFANCSVDGNQGNAPQNIFGELSAPERPSERLTRAVRLAAVRRVGVGGVGPISALRTGFDAEGPAGAGGVGFTSVVGPAVGGGRGLAVVEIVTVGPAGAGGTGLVSLDEAFGAAGGNGGGGGPGLAGDGPDLVVVGTAGAGGGSFDMMGTVTSARLGGEDPTGLVLVGSAEVGGAGLPVVGPAGAIFVGGGGGGGGNGDGTRAIVTGTIVPPEAGGGNDATGLVVVGPSLATSPLKGSGDCGPPVAGSGPEVILRSGLNVGLILRALNTFSQMPTGLG
ncbi:mediator of RNA polymerase II transcription subunit 15a isoform X1 [Cinnamomum micranthum f. kanehirae]|uniref:Mediator of RNA polymerase II transcription subunit 15a isoform X1 n=1 Tax=Cinnamomum micranthum f. kanehirae TaxID=337451 RepID=A0A3S3N0V8_9MAGN|nr:mediator of RNA polymerase II transcription subunit 15a isoform X1 [Cinnamomum micranthum f. kanehirae]